MTDFKNFPLNIEYGGSTVHSPGFTLRRYGARVNFFTFKIKFEITYNLYGVCI